MITLPVELQIKILQWATHVPNLLDIVPDPDEPFIPECPSKSMSILIKSLSQSLPTRHALPLVCRTFNAIATPLLYQCLLLDYRTIPLVSASLDLNPDNLSFVRHLLFDPQTDICRPSISPGLLAIFTALPPGVHTLSFKFHTRFAGQLGRRRRRTPSPDHVLLRAMARALGPSLRKLVMDYGEVAVLRDGPDIDVFTRSLVNLETIELRVFNIYGYKPRRRRRLRLPATLPRLRYLYIDQTDVAVPAGMAAAPTHVHFPLNKFISSVLHPAITHLSLRVLVNSPFKGLAAFASTVPGMVSLTLSGTYDSIARLLVACPLPTVTHLYISELHYQAGHGELHGLQAFIDAIGGLWMRGNERLVSVKFGEDTIVTDLQRWVRNGVAPLIGCGFAVEDRHGQALVDAVARAGETSCGEQGSEDEEDAF